MTAHIVDHPRQRSAALVVGTVALIAGVTGAVVNALALLHITGVPDLPQWAWGALGGALLMIRVKGKMGEIRQAARHTFLSVGMGHARQIFGGKR